MAENIQGVIDRVTFHNTENGFCVFKVKVDRQVALVPVVGFIPEINQGEYVTCSGDWQTDKNHGLQFKATSIVLSTPATLEGMERYLGSGLIYGIGPGFAKKIVAALGKDTFDIIENNPERLKSIAGIGGERYKKIISSWQQQKKVREIVVFLHQYGIGTSRAVKIYKAYGDKAVEKIKTNPYRLALDIRGIGFQTADVLAQKLDIPKDSIARASAGVQHLLQEQSSSGNCAIASQELIKLAIDLLDVDEKIIKQGIEYEVSQLRIVPEIILGEEYLFLTRLHQQEEDVAANIKRLQAYDLKFKFSAKELTTQQEINLSKGQQEAVKNSLANKVSIITGGPGVGKTTVINVIINAILKKTRNVLLAAPTGRAAKRMSECCNQPAKTLHRLLEFDPRKRSFKRCEEYPLIANFLIIDESSMLDLNMTYYLLRAIPNDCSLILIGDVDQLPSVGPGAILKDLIGSDKIVTSQLTEIFRQASTSQIIINAHKVNEGLIPALSSSKDKASDWYFIEANSPEEVISKLIYVVSKRVPERFAYDALSDIQVLSPMNRGGLGTATLNIKLQQALNKNKTKISKYGTDFILGDKVMQIVNNYDKDVFNGDIGFISNLDTQEDMLQVDFDGNLVEYEFNELDEIVLAYATSIHKSQGSEFPVVVIPFTMHHYSLLEKNLLYTAITRGKNLVIIIGQKKAIAMAVNNNGTHQRITNLQARLQKC